MPTLTANLDVAIPTFKPSRLRLWAGHILTGIPTLFLGMDAAMKLLRADVAVKGTAELGYPDGTILPLGIVELFALVALVIPRTRVLGAVIWTGYLGGAIATHVRLGHPLLTHTLFPIWVAMMIWGGLYLRDRRVRDAIAAP